MEEKIKVVNEILAQIEVFYKPTIYVFNKADLPHSANHESLAKKYSNYSPQFVSTISGKNLDKLKTAISELLR